MAIEPADSARQKIVSVFWLNALLNDRTVRSASQIVPPLLPIRERESGSQDINIGVLKSVFTR